MPVSATALQEWLARPLRDSNAAKKKTPEQLQKALARLPVPAGFVTEPHRHQLTSFLLGLKYKGYAYFLDPGLGKTKLSLDLVRWLAEADLARGALVCVPGVTHVDGWLEEGELHAPGILLRGVHQNTRAKRMEQFELEADAHVITYAGLMSFMCVRGTDRKGKPCMVPNHAALKELGKRTNTLVLDESTTIGGNTSTTFSMLRSLRKHVKRCYILTGTPFSRDPSPLWAQMYLADQGETLAKHINVFRSAFFKEETSHFSPWPTYKFDKSKKHQLNRMLRHHSVRYTDEEVDDLPTQVGGLLGERFMVRKVRTDPETQRYYDKVHDELVEAKGNYNAVKSAYIRMRTLSVGWLGVVDPQGDRIEFEFKNNPVLDAMEQLLAADIPQDRKVIVSYYYHGTGSIIEKRLKKNRTSYARLDGHTSDKRAALRSWKQGNKRVLLASYTIAYGLNLQKACNHLVIVESTSDVKARRQLEKRLRRPGQTRKVFVWDIVREDTLGPRVLRSLRNGNDLYEDVMGGKEEL